MASYVSRKDLDEIRPRVDRIVNKVVGGSYDASLVSIIMNCVSNGYDIKKTAEKLGSLVDVEKAAKIADRVSDAVAKVVNGSRKDTHEKRSSDITNDETKKKHKMEESNGFGIKEASEPSKTNLLSETQIKDMMANAQRMIEERKRALNNSVRINNSAIDHKETSSNNLSEKQKKILALQAQIQSKISSGVLKTFAPSKPSADKPAPLILDSEGRTIDVTGKEVQLTHVIPTLKANIRARKREEFKQQLHDKPTEDISESTFFDARISTKSSIRTKRALKFNEPGKFQQLAERMRMRAQLEKLQSEISQIARKTGISSAAKLALSAAKEEIVCTDDIPDIEWWDSVILNDDSYDYIDDEENAIKIPAITNLVEHPTQMRPPTDPLKPIYMPVFLTKEERKKLRRQNRREAWKEEQEKIRLGLEPPPEPKLRISNLMRVLGTEAVQDPTKMEAHVRAQMAKRQKAHEEANASRKLTPEQKREKKIKKLQEDTSLGVHVSLYRVYDLTNPAKKFKIETNANQLFMTGGVVMYQDCNIVIVEGGEKQQKKFKRLMLHRIKWEEDFIKSKDKDVKDGIRNKCVLIWEGMRKERNFGEMKFKVCLTEKLAREQLKKHGVEQYWDLAYNKHTSN